MVANVALGIVAVLIALHLFGVQLPALGRAWDYFDYEEPRCLVEWRGNFTAWNDLSECCLAAREELQCEQTRRDEQQEWRCHTGNGTTAQYWLNAKAYRYCTQLQIWS